MISVYSMSLFHIVLEAPPVPNKRVLFYQKLSRSNRLAGWLVKGEAKRERAPPRAETFLPLLIILIRMSIAATQYLNSSPGFTDTHVQFLLCLDRCGTFSMQMVPSLLPIRGSSSDTFNALLRIFLNNWPGRLGESGLFKTLHKLDKLSLVKMYFEDDL